MKIVEITPITPWKDNRRGTSAIQYHLLAGRSENICVEIWTFNYNDLSQDEIKVVEEELKLSIHVLKKPWFRTFIVDKRLNGIRLILKYPIFNYIWLDDKTIKEIDLLRPDGVWIYGEEMGRVSKQLNKYKRVHTLPDAQSLYYERLGGVRKLISGAKFRRMENAFDRKVKYHLVGIEDVKWLRKVASGIDAYFIRHPYYELRNKIIDFNEKVKLLVAGKNDLYMSGKSEELIEVLEGLKLVNGYDITFLGQGWNKFADRLNKVGYNVRVIEYVDDYVEEVINHDVQITPIYIGTGTKGKVLDAMANGLLVVGTEYALENIAKGGVLYGSKEELEGILLDILNDRPKYEKIAECARENVRREHNRFLVSQQMIGLLE